MTIGGTRLAYAIKLFTRISKCFFEVVAPLVTRDFASPAHTPDDDIPLGILRKNIKIEKGVV